ncbi:acyl-CoA dehydrogenase family protein, partial [Dehalococcoidia bacterium]|nr:acyl-CoA dehydrogenase family protein [Dehalococcoidia bacterium]
AVEEIAKACAATSTIYIAHVSLCTQFIHMFGTEEQKRQFIPPLVRGDKIGAFALTEPEAGSDPASMKTMATPSNGSYHVSGTKTFITNAIEASTFVVMTTMDRGRRTRGINALVIEKGAPGMSVTRLPGQMGIRASSTSEVIFENFPVPDKNRLGEEGSGFREAMEVLNTSRISIAAQCVGIAQAAYDAALNYTQQRRAFGQRLAEFQGLQWMLVDMATAVDAARLLTLRAATLRDKNIPSVTEASMAKLFASRVAVENSDKAVQMHGGAGYFAPANVERYYRDAKITEIYEGTSEIQRLIIARNLIPSDPVENSRGHKT